MTQFFLPGFDTDAFVRAWEPSAKPFFTAVLTFEEAGGGKTGFQHDRPLMGPSPRSAPH